MTQMTEATNLAQSRPVQSRLIQYWVVGGEFRDTQFSELTGPAEAVGPFASYDAAFKVWQDRSVKTRPNAHMRYTIAANPGR
ncbi:MAG TPA: DUF4170 domain-containing protein [Stellaceae bacterium]|nr:DUF4170 domain-containing protein [Stellaceae bacterium]